MFSFRILFNIPDKSFASTGYIGKQQGRQGQFRFGWKYWSWWVYCVKSFSAVVEVLLKILHWTGVTIIWESIEPRFCGKEQLSFSFDVDRVMAFVWWFSSYFRLKNRFQISIFISNTFLRESIHYEWFEPDFFRANFDLILSPAELLAEKHLTLRFRFWYSIDR